MTVHNEVKRITLESVSSCDDDNSWISVISIFLPSSDESKNASPSRIHIT